MSLQRLCSLAIGTAIALCATSARATPYYASRLPNAFTASCGDTPNQRCITCHQLTDFPGCGTRTGCESQKTIFGRDFCLFGQTWASVYNRDPDGDGFTSGEELLDPDGDGVPFASSSFSDPSNSASVPNECDFPQFNQCVATATCTDRPGKGRYDCACPSPLIGNGRSGEGGTGCLDPRACQLPGQCGGHGSCVPGASDFSCNCEAGYFDNGWTCQDIDGCELNRCGIGGSACIDQDPEGYTCACYPGYEFDQTTCVRIDQCRNDPCGAGVATCSSLTANQFTCTCISGYRLQGGVCVPDPCSLEPCGDFGTCSEVGAGYTCGCVGGYTFAFGTCVDRDECAEVETYCGSHAGCENSPSSYACSCDDGYATGESTTNEHDIELEPCEDIDECASGTAQCHSDAVCSNVPGGYDCECKDGFRGSGRLCVDVDECAENLHRCGERSICTNTKGAYLCSCPPGLSQVQSPPEGIELACAETCGDGLTGPQEACDDANEQDGDGCAACEVELGWSCTRPRDEASECAETCGDGFIDPSEECDEGALNSDSAADACRVACVWWSCGDGVVDSNELCDPEQDATCDAHCGVPGSMDGGSGDGGPGSISGAIEGGRRDAGAAPVPAQSDDNSGCSVAGASDAALLPALWLLAFRLRRRRVNPNATRT